MFPRLTSVYLYTKVVQYNVENAGKLKYIREVFPMHDSTNCLEIFVNLIKVVVGIVTEKFIGF